MNVTLSRRSFFAGLAAAAAGACALRWSSAVAQTTGSFGDLIGRPSTYVTQENDTLIDLARRLNVGFTELRAANPGIDAWLPGVGVTLNIPSMHVLPDGERMGIVINVGDQRAYYFPKNGAPTSHPIGVGDEGWATPIGTTTVVRKQANPTWYPPKSIRARDPELPAVVRPGPDNPLGAHAIYLGWPSYLMHGTNKPAGVGRRVSHGCIRMYPEDIARLFREVPIGTPVAVINQTVKTGWRDGRLYLEVHPTAEQADEIEATGRHTPAPAPDVAYRLANAAGDQVQRLDWNAIRTAVAERSGQPVPVLLPAAAAAPEQAKS